MFTGHTKHAVVSVLWRKWQSNYTLHIVSGNLLQCEHLRMTAGQSGHDEHGWPWHRVATITCGCRHLNMPVLAHTGAEHRKTIISPHVYVCTVPVSAYSMDVHHVDPLFRDTEAES